MDADFTTGLGSSQNSRQESYRLTHPEGSDQGSSANPVLTGIDTGSSAALGRTALDQPEHPVQWSSPMTRRTNESDSPQRRSVQDFAAAPRLSTPEVDTPARRSVQDFDAVPSFTVEYTSATNGHSGLNGHAVAESDSRRTTQDLESSRRAAQDLEASLRRAAELEAAVRRVATEPEPEQRLSGPAGESAGYLSAPPVESAGFPSAESAPRLSGPAVESAVRLSAPAAEPAARLPLPDAEPVSHRAASGGDAPAHRSLSDLSSWSSHTAMEQSSSGHEVRESNSSARRSAPESSSANSTSHRAAPESNSVSHHAAPEANSSSGRRAAPEPELLQPDPIAGVARSREFRAENAPAIDLHHIMRLLVASHDLDVAAQAAEAGEGSIEKLAQAARRTRGAAVDLVAAWYGGPDHMRRFGEVLLQAAAETA
ncbi:hypothetical protein [Nocardia acidivorans]|uniref:hypothetical protein n=1 Tax=Nocardia acidivorans TaxID=404580 RepID=UPI00082C42D7|nr:hypothetical protein [Nocardia acidivorans]